MRVYGMTSIPKSKPSWRDIAGPMEALWSFDTASAGPVEGQQLPGVRLFRGEIGDAENLFCAVLPVLHGAPTFWAACT